MRALPARAYALGALFVVLILIGLGVYRFRWGSSWSGRANEKLAIVSAKEEARMKGLMSLNGKPPPQPRIRGWIEKGDDVSVLWETAGKDYLACYVRSSSGIRGWILCTDLNTDVEPAIYAR